MKISVTLVTCSAEGLVFNSGSKSLVRVSECQTELEVSPRGVADHRSHLERDSVFDRSKQLCPCPLKLVTTLFDAALGLDSDDRQSSIIDVSFDDTIESSVTAAAAQLGIDAEDRFGRKGN